MAKQVIASTRPCGFCRLGVCARPGILSPGSMALTDDLTSLYNRRGFLRAATRLLSAATQDKREALLFYIDVDDLKSVNDSAGHTAGDSLLIRTKQVLWSVFRDSDVIG